MFVFFMYNKLFLFIQKVYQINIIISLILQFYFVFTIVGSIGTVFIGKLACSKPPLKPGEIEEVVDPKKPPKPPKPGTSKLHSGKYHNFACNCLFNFKFLLTTK